MFEWWSLHRARTRTWTPLRSKHLKEGRDIKITLHMARLTLYTITLHMALLSPRVISGCRVAIPKSSPVSAERTHSVWGAEMERRSSVVLKLATFEGFIQ